MRIGSVYLHEILNTQTYVLHRVGMLTRIHTEYIFINLFHGKNRMNVYTRSQQTRQPTRENQGDTHSHFLFSIAARDYSELLHAYGSRQSAIFPVIQITVSAFSL